MVAKVLKISNAESQKNFILKCGTALTRKGCDRCRRRRRRRRRRRYCHRRQYNLDHHCRRQEQSTIMMAQRLR